MPQRRLIHIAEPLSIQARLRLVDTYCGLSATPFSETITWHDYCHFTDPIDKVCTACVTVAKLSGRYILKLRKA